MSGRGRGERGGARGGGWRGGRGGGAGSNNGNNNNNNNSSRGRGGGRGGGGLGESKWAVDGGMKSSRDWGTGGAPKSTKDWSTPGGSASTGGGRGGGQWGRLKPPPQKESEFGFVSKGDSSLKDKEAQEWFYEDIVTRFTKFCTTPHPSDREQTFLSFSMPAMVKNGGPCVQGLGSNNKAFSDMVQDMRKLREALLSTGRDDEWAINVYLFFTRACILMKYKEGYRPPLERLLAIFGDPEKKVANARLQEVAGYYMLDIAAAQEDYNRAYMVKVEHGITDQHILDGIRATIHRDYWLYNKAKAGMSLYQRRVLEFAEEKVRLSAIASLQKSYFTLPKAVVEKVMGVSFGGLRERFGVAWEVNEADGKSVVTIRKVKTAAKPAAAQPPAPAPPPKKVVDAVVPTNWDD